MHKRKLISVLLVLLLAACASTEKETVNPEYLPMVVEPGVASTPLPPEGSSQTGLQLEAGELILTVLSPADEEAFSTTPIMLRFLSNEDTVLTINGEIYLLDAGKETAFPLDLVEGYNSIELVASDYAGNQVEKVLTVLLDLSEE